MPHIGLVGQQTELFKRLDAHTASREIWVMASMSATRIQTWLFPVALFRSKSHFDISPTMKA